MPQVKRISVRAVGKLVQDAQGKVVNLADHIGREIVKPIKVGAKILFKLKGTKLGVLSFDNSQDYEAALDRIYEPKLS